MPRTRGSITEIIYDKLGLENQAGVGYLALG